MGLSTGKKAGFVLVGLAVLGLSSAAWANVYPSAVSVEVTGFDNLCGTATISFTLNEEAAGDGVNPGVKIEILDDTEAVVRTINIGRLGKGRHSYEWDGRDDAGNALPNGDYTARITAADFGYTAWTQVSDDDLHELKFEYPMGVAVNKNVDSPNFGRIYVSVARVGTIYEQTRVTSDGIYVLGADQTDILGQGDAAFAGGMDWVTGTTSSPWKITVAPDDKVYIADWSDGHSGVWRCDANPQVTFEEVLSNTGRQSTGLVPGVHGSVAALFIEGTGEQTKLYTLDEDYPDAAGAYSEGRGDIFRYDIGTSLSYSQAPVVQVDDASNSSGSPYAAGLILNALMDFVRDADGTWWSTQYRSTGQDTAGVPSLMHWEDGATGPIWTSGGKAPDLGGSYGSIAIHDGLDLLALGTYTGNIFLIDISDPANPTLSHTIAHSGSTIRDVDFDAAGNLYVVSNSSERLRIYSPPVGANSFATASSAITLNKTATNGPQITDQPDDVVICVGDSANFAIAATVGANPSYQWTKNGVDLVDDGTNVVGATTTSLTLNNVAAADAGALITCVVCDDGGVAVSDPAILGVGVAFLEAPISQFVCVNTDVVFTVNVVGKGTISYQWQRDAAGNGVFTNVGDNSPVLTLSAVQQADNGTQVKCLVTDDCGQVESPTAVLTVSSGPDLVVMYADRTVTVGGSTFFQIDANGTGDLSFQWYKDTGSGPVPLVDGPGVGGATASRMYVSALGCSDNGALFSVAVTDACGTITSIQDQTPGYPALATNGVCLLTVGGEENADPAGGSTACSNGIDDDCDGLIDCDDPDCAGDYHCGPDCPEPFADWDRDNDVDMLDFAELQRCYTLTPTAIESGCECFDYNHDGKIDEDDFTVFMACGSGPGIDLDPDCDRRPSGLGKVVVNELVYDVLDMGGLETPDIFEFIELYNRSAENVDISGWIVRAFDDNVNRAFLVPGGVGSGTTILAPGGYYLIASANVPLPTANPPYVYVHILPPGEDTDVLENGPDGIELLDANREPTDTLIYGRRWEGTINASAPEGAVWGDMAASDSNDPVSLSRWFDGRDTDDNGRDFGLRPRTPGLDNQGTASIVTSYVLPSVDGLGSAAPVPGFGYAYQPALAVNPDDITTKYNDLVVNPNAIAPSPQGGKVVVAWDSAGGGNMVFSKDLMNNAGGFDLWVYLDTSFAAWGSDVGNESTTYGVMGTTNTSYFTPDPEGVIATAATTNGNTGLCWVYQKVKPDGGAATCKLFLMDAGPGGDSRPSAGVWQTHGVVDMTGAASGWYRLSISYDGTTGAVTANGAGQAFNFNTATGLAGGFYVGYREAAGTTENPVPTYLRPATFDSVD